MISRIFSFLFLAGLSLFLPLAVLAVTADTLRLRPDAQHFSLELGGTMGQLLVVDQYQRLWQRGTALHGVHLGLRYHSQESDSCDFATAYGYPEWGLHLSWNDFSGVTMQKQGNWGYATPVDYLSHMGQVYTLYGSFSRPLLRTKRWQLGYGIEEGLAYNTHPYRRADNVDNELTGSSFLLYVGASFYAAFRLDARWTLRGDVSLRHVSNGATYRPNKGANWWTPTVALQYRLSPSPLGTSTSVSRRAHRFFTPRWYATLGLSVGLRTLLEEWLRTQYDTPSHHPDYRTDRFRTYYTLNLQADFMRRYARKWASGVGIDGFYLPYVSRLRELDGGDRSKWQHSPWSLGVAAKHEAFYGPLSFYLSLGYYLYRHTGSQQPYDETPYYERIGLRYRLTRVPRLSVGLGIKAHRTKADFTELTLAYDL